MSNNNALAYAQLRFQVDVPSLEETWLDGYQAGSHDKPEESNPYAMDSKEYAFWNEGWWAGFYQETPLFDLSGAVHAVENKVATQQKNNVDSNAVIKTPSRYIIRTIQVFAAILAAAMCYQLADFFA